MKETKEEKNKRIERLRTKEAVISAIVDEDLRVEEMIISGTQASIKSLILTVIENAAALVNEDVTSFLVDLFIAEMVFNNLKQEDNINGLKEELEERLKEMIRQ